MRAYLGAVEIGKVSFIASSPIGTESFNDFHVLLSKHAKEVRNFIIDPDLIASKELEYESDLLSAPFPNFSIESTGNNALAVLKYSDDADRVTQIECMIGFEKEPSQFVCYGLHRDITGMSGNIPSHQRPSLVEMQPHEFTPILTHLFDSLRKKVVATEKVNARFKVNINGKKDIVKIREVIHVRSKRFEGETGEYGGPVDYSHRFEVMGHWRKIEGIGKDRGGAYCVKGLTWVVPHVKGPEDKPLIPKQRVIHAPEVNA